MKVESVPTLKDGRTLREEVFSQWHDLRKAFLQDTSLHGWKYVPCQRRHILVRILWALLLLTMIGVSLSALVDLYKKYYSYSFITKITRERKQQIRFPAITICTLNKFDISKQNLTNAELRYLRSFGYLAHMSPQVDWDGEEGRELDKLDNVKFWAGGEYKKEDIFKVIFFKNNRILPESLNYSQKQDHRCFTFNANADVNALESEHTALLMSIDIMQDTYLEGATYEAGVQVYIDEPETAPSYNDHSLIGVSVGTSTRIGLTKKKMKYLPDPYNTRGTDCIDTTASDFVNPLEWFKVYSFDGCLQECSNKAAMNACNCTAGWEPQQTRVSLRHCSVKEVKTCYDQVQWEVRMGKSCACQYPCEETSYDMQVSSMVLPSNVTFPTTLLNAAYTPDKIRQNYLVLQIRLASMVVERTEHIPELELGEIFANIGGQIGLFLGASILTIVELLELVAACLLTSLAILCARRKRHG
ncbi:acid-sensing ion channel 1B-like [Haliotis rubra]|uniref:acid-sensing ion channel 1B-like n=1 Tax=Haliotis rubra TaxID=36100 RepID=UPI001EE5CA25|nr:acid-sensing ion channel 1B-like [Haliotis rubra]